MGPVVKREDLQAVLTQVNSRFDYFTKECKRLQGEIDSIKGVKPVAKEKQANG